MGVDLFDPDRDSCEPGDQDAPLSGRRDAEEERWRRVNYPEEWHRLFGAEPSQRYENLHEAPPVTEEAMRFLRQEAIECVEGRADRRGETNELLERLRELFEPWERAWRTALREVLREMYGVAEEPPVDAEGERILRAWVRDQMREREGGRFELSDQEEARVWLQLAAYESWMDMLGRIRDDEESRWQADVGLRSLFGDPLPQWEDEAGAPRVRSEERDRLLRRHARSVEIHPAEDPVLQACRRFRSWAEAMLRIRRELEREDDSGSCSG